MHVIPIDASTCPVAALGRQIAANVAEFNRIDSNQNSDAGRRRMSDLDDRRDGLEAAASEFLATSAAGAMLQIMLAMADLDCLESHTAGEDNAVPPEMAARARSADRCLWSAMLFIERATGVPFEAACGEYYARRSLSPFASASIEREDGAGAPLFVSPAAEVLRLAVEHAAGVRFYDELGKIEEQVDQGARTDITRRGVDCLNSHAIRITDTLGARILASPAIDPVSLGIKARILAFDCPDIWNAADGKDAELRTFLQQIMAAGGVAAISRRESTPAELMEFAMDHFAPGAEEARRAAQAPQEQLRRAS